MNPVDHLFILLLFAVQPVYGVIETRRYEARARAGEPFDRLRFYRETAIMEWVFLAALAIAWLAFDRPIADLGITAPGGTGFHVGAVLLVAAVGLFVYSWQAAKRASGPERARQRRSIENVVQFVPHTRQELGSFMGVSITAGIVEEIVYRGFVLWYLELYMPLSLAIAVSSFAFGLAHSYQGPSGALRCGLVGLVFGLFYVMSGSIWLPIIGHILLDALQGLTTREILREEGNAAQAQPT